MQTGIFLHFALLRGQSHVSARRRVSLLHWPTMSGGGTGLRSLLLLCVATGLSEATDVFGADQPSAGRTVGWRGDGSGLYLSASPVIHWSATENVRWKAKVGTGQSSPIVIGQRIFVTAEPDLLICLEAETGKELWRKSHKLSNLPAAVNAKDHVQSSP